MISFLDNDAYTFSVAQAVLHHFPSVEAEYKFICRTKDADLLPHLDKINRKIDLLCDSKITQDELTYLRTLTQFTPDFIYFLEDFTLKRKFVKVYSEDGKLAISIKGPMLQTIWFEVPILAIVSNTYCESRIKSDDAYEEGRKNLESKIDFFQRLENPFHFADFGTRRRYSKPWQEYMVKTFKERLPEHFLGTSNLDMARRFSLKEIGTQSHQYFQIGQGLDAVRLSKSQKYMLEKWAYEYRGKLGIALTDTLTMDAFLADFDFFLASVYSGCRQDSGDPFVWCKKLIDHYNKLGIDPLTKTAVFSDNLNFEKASEINDYFKNKIKVTFGIGTWLSNHNGVNPLSMVIKLVRINGNPVAKISDEPSKSICEDLDFLRYLKSVFGLS